MVEFENKIGHCHVYCHPCGLALTVLSSVSYPMRVAFGLINEAIRLFQEVRILILILFITLFFSIFRRFLFLHHHGFKLVHAPRFLHVQMSKYSCMMMDFVVQLVH